jgi:DNA invertase Pin-like site-specific DNA recombinase
MERVHERFGAIKVLDRKWLDLTTPIGKGILAFLSALAEDERERINRRSNAGRKKAHAKGVKFGPKFKLTQHQQGEALEMLEAGRSLRAVARTFNVDASTIQRLKDR